MILLAGKVGRSPLADGVARSVLDLPVSDGRTLLDVWIGELDAFAAAYDLPSLSVQLSIEQGGVPPTVRTPASSRVEVRLVSDPGEYRGTAGVVRDLTQGYEDTDRVLVAAANQVQREPLAGLFEDLCAGDESVSVVTYRGSEVAGMFLLRCGRLRDVPAVGFVDLKEQAIPAAHGRAPLRVTRRPSGTLLPVRTLDEYVHAVRVVHAPADGALLDDPFAEEWAPVKSIIEPGAQVAPTAILQDCVVLTGGRVESDAVVARSVVCKGGVVRRGECVVERIVTGS